MRKSLRIASLIMATLLFFSYNSLKAQVKIGGDPAVVDPNAILELESNRKGFLLPRLDAAGFTFLKTRTVTQGMVVYLKAGAHPNGAGFYFKTGTGNTDADWVKMAGDDGVGGGPWKLGGNNNADANSFIGTTISQPLAFKVNNNPAMSFATDGRLTIPYANIDVAGAGVNDVLMIGTDGKVQKQNLSLTSVTSLNALKGDAILGAVASPAATTITATTAGQNLTLNIPTMMGTAGQTYGFITKADWDRFNRIATANGLTVADITTTPAEAGNFAGKFVPNATAGNEGRWSLSLFPATDQNPGVVTVGDQTFAGKKIFDGDIEIQNNYAGSTGSLTTAGKLSIGTTDAADPAATSYKVLVKEGTGAEIKEVDLNPKKLGGISALTDPANASAESTTDGKVGMLTGTAGTDFNIVAGTNIMTFNIPDANATNRGVITTGAQTLGGVKTFANQVVASTNLSVGGAGQTASLSINGSVSVNVRTLPGGGGAIADNDYIVLVAGAGTSTVGVTLPTPAATNKGRIYIVKRIPQGGSVVEEDSIVAISAAGGSTINGQSAINIDAPHFSVTFLSDGTSWSVLSRSAATL
ncbi:hypothetical protein [Chitinophaga sp. YIM B06452]|uniref:hypothetical protein n=1 Tax=Chitinophaga sp. YIM B06452 TaxID=3082158 RepID=UPI0031FF05AA